MNSRQAFTAAALALLASSAFAGDEFDPLTGFGSATASSTAHAAAARAQAPDRPSALTREQVRDDARRALRDKGARNSGS